MQNQAPVTPKLNIEQRFTNLIYSALIAFGVMWIFNLLVADYYSFKHVPYLIVLFIVFPLYELGDKILHEKKIDRVYQSTVLREIMMNNLYAQYLLEQVYALAQSPIKKEPEKVDTEEKVE